MTSPRPWETQYTVEDTTVIAETPDLRVLTITLAAGEAIPWHYHSTVTDTFFCLEGALEIESRAPRASHALGPGDTCAVEPKTAHLVSNAGAGRCRFLLIQGIGTYDFVPVG